MAVVVNLKMLIAWRRHWPIATLGVFYAYLAMHALSGSRGIQNWFEYRQVTAVKQTKLVAAKAMRENLQSRVDALSSRHLNSDILDTIAREELFYLAPGEVTIYLDR